MDAVLPTSILGDDLVEQKRRDLLAKFGITGDRALTPVKNLSGGERCRVALARLTAAKANFLVLDEPTNHLDLWARDALEQALRRFDGTVLFVSHDRYFIDQVADHLLVFEGAQVRVIHGNYVTYQTLADARRVESAQKVQETASEESQTRRPVKRADQRSEGSGKRKRRFPYRKVEDIEADILQHESRREEIHRELSEPGTYRNGERVKQLKQELEALEQKLQLLYAHWEEAMELNG